MKAPSKKKPSKKKPQAAGLRRRLRLWSRLSSGALLLAWLALSIVGDIYEVVPALTAALS